MGAVPEDRAKTTSTPDGSLRPEVPGASLPLADVTVVTLEQAVAAPLATRHLADLGARVIKIERPDGGDFARHYDRTVHGESSYFVWLNRGKESITLDVKEGTDRVVLNAMIAAADVFVHNLAPGAAQRLGLDAESVRTGHPGLIHCVISGYGSGGPYERKKAYDLLLQCETGLVLTTGSPTEPAKAGLSIADIATGMYAFSGILTALYERRTTGEGASLHIAMLDALGEWMSQPAYFAAFTGEQPRRTGARHPSIAPYGPHRAGDGATVFLGIQNEREWSRFCHEVLGRPELATDPRFACNVDRVANVESLTAIIEAAFAGWGVNEVEVRLEAAEIANARLRPPQEIFDHPQVVARHRCRQVHTPGGPAPALLPPVIDPRHESAMGAVPALGEHSAALRAEFAAAQPWAHSASNPLDTNSTPAPPSARTTSDLP